MCAKSLTGVFPMDIRISHHKLVLGSSMNILQDRCKASRISPMDLDHEESLKELKEALQAYHQALEQLETHS